MRILFVTSEAYPLAKSGGLADVSSALPAALIRQGIDARLLLPGYPVALRDLRNARVEMQLKPLLGIEDAALISSQLPNSNVPVWLVNAPSLFSRPGGLYQDEGGRDWADNAQRFAFLAHVAARIAGGLVRWRPDVVHVNDWHAGLLPLLLSLEPMPAPATIFTIHNLAYQGNFPREFFPALGIPDRLFNPDSIEFYGQVSFLKAALRYSDKLTTVSPTYAKEVLTPEFGCGLDGVLREREQDLCGILNGIDKDVWNPAIDNHLPKRYRANDIAGKRMCKAELQRECGLEVDAETPLIGFVSRLAHQKMADVLLDAVPAIVGSGAQFVLVGKGDPGLETAFEQMGEKYPQKIAIRIGYEELAHRIQAGADILLAPARFEPCGLTHLYALRYGTVPVVRRTGGLADTVKDANPTTLADRTANGFAFDEPSVGGLLEAVRRAVTVYREPLTWRRLQLEGMAQDFGWNASAARYALIYSDVAELPLPLEANEARADGSTEQTDDVRLQIA
jgi:starch synthase